MIMLNIKADCCYLTLLVLFIENGLLFRIAVTQECRDVIRASYWCRISPEYVSVNVSKTQRGRVVCTIPQSTGLDISVKNQFGVEVRSDETLKNYINQISDPSVHPNAEDRSYDLEISWTPDREIQEKLKILQCEALFDRTPGYVCKTSVVNIHFMNEPKVSTTASGLPHTVDCKNISIPSANTDIPSQIIHNELESASQKSNYGHKQQQPLHCITLILSLLIIIIILFSS